MLLLLSHADNRRKILFSCICTSTTFQHVTKFDLQPLTCTIHVVGG